MAAVIFILRSLIYICVLMGTHTQTHTLGCTDKETLPCFYFNSAMLYFFVEV